MERETFLIVGLGNPGREYAHTRHNAGFDATDLLAEKLQLSLTHAQCKGLLGDTLIEGKKLVICQPQTFMNASGECVSALVHWYRVPLDHLMVLYDDIDLPPGRLRVRSGGSAGTHNGMRSILSLLSESSFPRIRIGVGDRPQGQDLVDWVLGHYPTQEEQRRMQETFQRAADCALDWVTHGIQHAMQTYNQNPKPEKTDVTAP